MPLLVLASASPYRRRLLGRICPEFVCDAPAIDETPLPGEPPGHLVQRLAIEKARRVASRHPGALIIASDQCGSCAGALLNKPGDFEAAVAQLRAMAGRELLFHTSICVLDTRDGSQQLAVESCEVRLRALGETRIRDYLRREMPLDCAGSFKVEGLGIALFERVRSDDPTILEGLPLIRLCEFLERCGAPVLAP